MLDDSATINGKYIRIDGRAKVTGSAVYPSDEPVAKPAHAFLVTSAIACGRVKGFNLGAARRRYRPGPAATSGPAEAVGWWGAWRIAGNGTSRFGTGTGPLPRCVTHALA